VRRHWLAVVLAAVALGIAAEWASYEPGELDRALADLLTGWVLVGCGVVAARRRGAERIATLMAATGFAWLAGSLVPEALYLHRGPLVHLLLGYPNGRVVRRPAQAVVVAAYLDGAIEPLGHSAVLTLALCASLLAAAVAGYLRDVGPRRRARAVSTAGAATVAAVLGFGALSQLAGWGGENTILLVYECVLIAIGLGFLADLRRGWSEAAVTGLVVELGERWEPVTLRGRLARALGDPSLQLGYWLGPEQGYADEDGHPFALPGPDAQRAVTPVEADGERVAVLVHDRTVLEDPELVEAVAAATRIAVTNVRLQAEVLARAEQLAASRRRIVEAADAQRRRLQGELRDGAERRLAAVAAHVEALDGAVEGPRAAELLANVEAQLRAATTELRELARGIHPIALTDGGLSAALPELAGRASLPVKLRIEAGRCPAPVEAAAYFVCAEALTNVAKYARASSVLIDVTQENGLLTVAIADDGCGGADPERGSGLRGLADRVEALGGRLSVDSPRGAGTRLVAEIPAE
jgi:signal transduction histidine kinase